jgi:hypothetical protein
MPSCECYICVAKLAKYLTQIAVKLTICLLVHRSRAFFDKRVSQEVDGEALGEVGTLFFSVFQSDGCLAYSTVDSSM